MVSSHACAASRVVVDRAVDVGEGADHHRPHVPVRLVAEPLGEVQERRRGEVARLGEGEAVGDHAEALERRAPRQLAKMQSAVLSSSVAILNELMSEP